MNDQPLSARRVAVDVLNQVDPTRQLVHAILAKNLDRTDQRQRCTDLVLGVVRNRRAIDVVIERFGRRPVERVARPLVSVIRLAVFELVYCPMTAVHAIVHEAVEVVKGSAGPRQVGFVNAVLRQVTGHLSDRQALLRQVDPRQVLPTDPQQGCVFDQPFLPDPKAEAADYLSSCFSLPQGLAVGWIGQFGYEQTWQIGLASNRRPGLYLRPNPLKTTAVDLVGILRQGGTEAELADGRMIRLSGAGAVEQIAGYHQGLFSVQDPTAAGVVWDLRPAAGWRMLDLCAAPGGKTIQLAEVTGDRATIVATDLDASRLKMLHESLDRLGVRSVQVIAYEALQDPGVKADGFDLVLVDAPCSNTGVMARRPEVRYRLSPEAIGRLVQTQVGLLEKAAGLVRQGGLIGYSTCSIQEAEDAGVVQTFLQSHPEFLLESERLTLPSAGPFDHDGGYVAVLRRP